MQAVSNIRSSDDIEFNTKVIKGVIKDVLKIYKKGWEIEKFNIGVFFKENRFRVPFWPCIS